MGLGQANIGGSEVWLGINSLLKVLRRFPILLVSSALTKTLQVRISLKVCLQHPGIYTLRLRRSHRLSRNDSFLNMASDILSDVTFERKRVVHVSLIRVRPQVSVRKRLDQLCSDAHAITRSLQRPL